MAGEITIERTIPLTSTGWGRCDTIVKTADMDAAWSVFKACENVMLKIVDRAAKAGGNCSGFTVGEMSIKSIKAADSVHADVASVDVIITTYDKETTNAVLDACRDAFGDSAAKIVLFDVDRCHSLSASLKMRRESDFRNRLINIALVAIIGIVAIVACGAAVEIVHELSAGNIAAQEAP